MVISPTSEKKYDHIISLGNHYSPDWLVCGGNHRGYLDALHKAPRVKDRRRIVDESSHFQRAKRIIAHSKMMQRELMEYYAIPASKIHCIYPSIDTQRFNRERRVQREDY